MERQDTWLTATLLLYANTPHSLFILHNTELGKPVPNKEEHVHKNQNISIDNTRSPEQHMIIYKQNILINLTRRWQSSK